MRAAIYARYSSDLQREASIEDQVEVCRRLIADRGWSHVATYDDAAVSGASRFRPGLARLMTEVEAGRLDVVVCEALDRLGRNLADVAGLFDRLTFRRVKLVTQATGDVTPMHIGMLGTMAQMYLSDLAEKTRRGQLGRALQGRIPGGKAYGYDVVAPGAGRQSERGERRINPAEADVVRRIFTLFADGASPRAIAKQLNAEGVPGPEGRPWRDTTIRGQAERATGILNNALYVGRLEWNRCAYVKDPRTGKRVARPNPRDQWEIVDVPDLRIVDDTLWDQVKARQQNLSFAVGRDADGNALNRAHRRKFLFSGLLECGVCGGGFTITGQDRYGCATRRSAGTCGNDRTIKRQEIEGRILAGLRDRLLTHDMIAEAATAFQEEVNRQRQEDDQARDRITTELAGIDRKIDAMLKAIEDGMYTPAMKARMIELEARKAELETILGQQPDADPIRLHPNLAAIYRQKVMALEEALNEEADRAEAQAIIRALIDRVVLEPAEDGGMKALLYGELSALLALGSGAGINNPGLAGPGCQLSVVAGARNRHCLLFTMCRLPIAR